jgi:hypothetical protein
VSRSHTKASRPLRSKSGLSQRLPGGESEGLDPRPLTPGLADGQPVSPTTSGPVRLPVCTVRSQLTLPGFLHTAESRGLPRWYRCGLADAGLSTATTEKYRTGRRASPAECRRLIQIASTVPRFSSGKAEYRQTTVLVHRSAVGLIPPAVTISTDGIRLFVRETLSVPIRRLSHHVLTASSISSSHRLREGGNSSPGSHRRPRSARCAVEISYILLNMQTMSM